MASEKSPSLLRASLIFFLASLMLGSAAMYIQFGIVSTIVIWRLFGTGLRSTVPEILRASKPVWGMLLLFAVIFAITLSLNESVSISEMGELKWLFFPLIFAAALNVFSGGAQLRMIEKVAIAFLLLVTIYSTVDSIYQVVTGKNMGRLLFFGESLAHRARASGLLRNPIPFAHVAGSLFHVGIVGALISYSVGKRKMTAVFSVITLMFFVCVLASYVRGAWLAIALTALFSFVVMPSALRRINTIGLGAATLIGGVVLAFNGTLFQRFLSSFDPADTASSVRLHLWRANLELLMDYPFGMGFNANDLLLPKKLAELGYPAESFQTHPHNEYLDYAVATGFPGLLLYLGITIWLLVFTVKLLRRANLTGTKDDVFLLTSSALVQSFLNTCALTDQFTTPGRFLICFAWAVPLAIAVKYRKPSAVG